MGSPNISEPADDGEVNAKEIVLRRESHELDSEFMHAHIPFLHGFKSEFM